MFGDKMGAFELLGGEVSVYRAIEYDEKSHLARVIIVHRFLLISFFNQQGWKNARRKAP